MIKILIIEDQVIIANFIETILLDNNYINVKKVYKINQALEAVELFKPDLVLLDINLNDSIKGIEFAKKKLKDKSIIYITGQTEIPTLNIALKTEPLAYLTKPIREVELLAAVKLANKSSNKSTIVLKDGHDEVLVKKATIIYAKSDRNYVDVYTKFRKITIRASLEILLKELDEDCFIKVHRSYLVNKDFITKKRKSSIELNDITIPISRKLNLEF